MKHIVAGIVTYKPDLTVLADLIAAIASEVVAIVIVANSPMKMIESAYLQQIAGATPVHFDDPGENIGLGGAYERIMSRAGMHGDAFEQIERVILFDQDSSPSIGMISALATRMETLHEMGERPALLGPKPISASPEHKPPTIHRHSSGRITASSQAVWFAISSGSLIDVTAFHQVGAFRSDFFIDAIDIEWCFRAWSTGYSCWMADDILMPHRLGTGYITVPFIGWKLPIQSPLRLGTYARNQAALLRFNHIPKRWKIRICLYMAMQMLAYWLADHGNIARPHSLIKGFITGLAGRLGPPPEVKSTTRRVPSSAPPVKVNARG